MDPSLHAIFVEETVPLAADVESRVLKLERDAAALADEWRSLLGVLHTIKGNCGMVELEDAQALAHAMEERVRGVRRWSVDVQGHAVGDLLAAADVLRAAIIAEGPLGDQVRSTAGRLAALDPAAPETADGERGPTSTPKAEPEGRHSPVSHVRVPAERLDRLLESTSELMAYHERLDATTRARARRRLADPDLQAMLDLIDRGGRRLGELRTAITGLCLVPLSMVVRRFDRMVRDLARTTGKRAALVVHGGGTAVDKSVVDHLAEPLMHLVRNAIDHGIEPPRERILAGKPESGIITIEAEAQGNVLTVRVRDDGRGIDRARLATAAASRGIDTAGWTDQQVIDLVFAPELSTAEQVTTLSGRGVGLDQARRTLERIGGCIEVLPAPAGAEFRLRAPLMIAVQRALLVATRGETYAVPFTAVIEAFRVARRRLGAGGAVTPWREREIPLCVLGDELAGPGGPPAPDDTDAPAPASPPAWSPGRDLVTCVVVDAGNQPLAIAVDSLVGQQDLVVKQLDPVFGRPRGVSGAAILADGRAVLVIDPYGIGRGLRPGGVA